MKLVYFVKIVYFVLYKLMLSTLNITYLYIIMYNYIYYLPTNNMLIFELVVFLSWKISILVNYNILYCVNTTIFKKKGFFT